MKYSLIIPAHNEAEVIAATLTLLAEAFVSHGQKNKDDSAWEIIVVDNASTDGTADVVRSINDKRIMVVERAERGKGLAIRAGFREATGDVIGFTDADLSVAPEEVVDAFYRVGRDRSHVLIGSRFHPASAMPGREWWRTGSSQVFNFFARSIVGVSFSDTQCPLKVMNKDGHTVMCATKEDTWFFDLEFLALVSALGLTIEETPVSWTEHRYPERKSKLTPKDSFNALIAMRRIRARHKEQLSKLRKK